MTNRKELRWRCDVCEGMFSEADLLTAPNPFDAADIITGCPKCKSVGEFTNICDEPECSRAATCGFRDPEGYRRTCGEHYRKSRTTSAPPSQDPNAAAEYPK